MDLGELYKKQISLHEWFEQIGHNQAQAVRDEDLSRQERLKVLSEITGLSYDKPEIFSPHDILNYTQKFKIFFEKEKNNKCRLRLLPLSKDAPKLRTVGRTVAESVEWFKQQHIDSNDYELHFLSFTEQPQWATIFVINNYGIYGEIVWGGHNQLTQGFHDAKPITFTFNFNEWKLSEINIEVLKHLKQIISFLNISDNTAQGKLREKLNATFTNNYLEGYFETVSDVTIPLQFIDYNRVLGKIYKNFQNTPQNQTRNSLIGQTGSPGIVTGRVKIVIPKKISQTQLQPDEILVCDMTSPDYVPLMKQSAGIITDR